MSWNAYLTDDRGHSEGEWGYTHNTNGMIEATLDDEEVAGTRAPFWARPGSSMGRGAWSAHGRGRDRGRAVTARHLLTWRRRLAWLRPWFAASVGRTTA